MMRRKTMRFTPFTSILRSSFTALIACVGCGEVRTASGSEVKWFTNQMKYWMINFIFHLHSMVDLGDVVCNNTRHASVNFGSHAHPGGSLFGGLGDEIR
jgi:hypothetical protein